MKFRKIQKNLNFMVDKHNSQCYYNWAVANNCFWKTNNWKEFQKNEIHCWQKTEDMIKYLSRQRSDNKILTQKCLKKTWRKYLTNKKRWDRINELSERQTKQTLITKQWNTYDSRKFLYILKNGFNKPKAVKTRDSQTVVLSDWIKHFIREFDPGSGWTLAACLTHASRTGITLLKLRWI